MSDFDITRFLQLSGRVQTNDFNLEAAKQVGITHLEARILRYMADTESHTILYLRDLLAGHTCHDPEITAFLSVWVYEELWHGRAIDELLTLCGHTVKRDNFTQVAKQVNWREPLEATLSHLAAWSTPRFVATHMAWGAINELTAAAAYKALERRTKNPALALLLNRIAKQERKHFAFYYHQAHKRLQQDTWAQNLCSYGLKLLWSPVGSGVGHTENLAFIIANLFGDDNDKLALQEVDKTIARLPGLGWFDLVTKRTDKILHNFNKQPAKAWFYEAAT